MQHRLHRRGDVASLVAALAGWDAAGVYVSGLHAGDVGWAQRQPDAVMGGVHGWWAEGRLVATMLADEDWGARPRIAPQHRLDRSLAVAVREHIESLTGAQLWSDAAPGTALRHELLLAGWEPDPDPWVSLHLDLADPPAPSSALPVRLAADDVPGRVAAQRAGFERSTFDAPSWERMAAGPGYRADLDLVVVVDGEPAAVATAWLSVPGGTAILEPVAVDPRFRGHGLGRGVVLAAAAACRSAGASGLSVCTPASNAPAVAAYRSAGFVRAETLESLTLARTRS